MAQGDVIQAALGDTVKISVTLDFKKAQVDRRSDAENFRRVGFFILEGTKNKIFIGRPVFNVDADFITSDDQTITVDCHLKDPTPGDQSFVQGDVFDVFMQYLATEEADHSDNTRKHFMGRIGIGVLPPKR